MFVFLLASSATLYVLLNDWPQEWLAILQTLLGGPSQSLITSGAVGLGSAKLTGRIYDHVLPGAGDPAQD